MKKFDPPPQAVSVIKLENPLLSLNESLAALRALEDYISLVVECARQEAFYAAWESRPNHIDLSKEEAYKRWQSLS